MGLVAADRKNEGRPEARALEIVIEKLQRIARELGSVGAVLPGDWTGSVRRLLQQAKATHRGDGALLDTPEAARVAEDLTRLAARNLFEIEEAEQHVAKLGTTDDFETQLGDLLRSAFRGWDDGGAIEPIGKQLVRVRVPARLRGQIGTATIDRATFRRDIAVAAADEREEFVPEFLVSAHPLVEGTLRALRDEASDPKCRHRFDVTGGEREGLILSFAMRFVDGEGRTAEEALAAVELQLDATVSTEPSS